MINDDFFSNIISGQQYPILFNVSLSSIFTDLAFYPPKKPLKRQRCIPHCLFLDFMLLHCAREDNLLPAWRERRLALIARSRQNPCPIHPFGRPIVVQMGTTIIAWVAKP